MKHKSVLLEEVINYLNVKQGGIYVDATVGYAGHSSVILKKIGKEGVLFAFDQDDEAIEYSTKRLSAISDNFTIFKSNFVNMKKYINENVDGIIFDLGVSSPQLDEAERGFSFHKDAPLDMRMDQSNPLNAKIVVNEYSYQKLTEILFKFGEEKYAKSIAKAIIEARPIETTLELAEVIKNSVPISYRNKSHPARKTFQAIRIEVNHELDILESSLRDAFDLLKVGGRLEVISFHSLEDKIVAKVFKDLCSDDVSTRKLPVVPIELSARAKKIVKITPSDDELDDNNRSRSSKLRVIERVRSMKQKRYVKTKGEGLLKTLAVIFFVAFLLSTFVLSAKVQSSNSELQRLKSKIESQEKMNLSMQMKINELASLDNALEVADANDLKYNNSNIRVISK